VPRVRLHHLCIEPTAIINEAGKCDMQTVIETTSRSSQRQQLCWGQTNSIPRLI